MPKRVKITHKSVEITLFQSQARPFGRKSGDATGGMGYAFKRSKP
jgi:hypothetical protein